MSHELQRWRTRSEHVLLARSIFECRLQYRITDWDCMTPAMGGRVDCRAGRGNRHFYRYQIEPCNRGLNEGGRRAHPASRSGRGLTGGQWFVPKDRLNSDAFVRHAANVFGSRQRQSGESHAILCRVVAS
jgi:hypothetical protein